MASPRRRNNKDTTEAVERQQAAVDLARKGCSYDEIAAQLGYQSRSGAYGAVQAVLNRADYAAADGLRNLQGLEIDEYKLQLRRKFADLWDGGQTELAVKVLDRVVRLWERQARLFGLDAPVQVDARISDATDAAIAELAEQLGMASGRRDTPSELTDV